MYLGLSFFVLLLSCRSSFGQFSLDSSTLLQGLTSGLASGLGSQYTPGGGSRLMQAYGGRGGASVYGMNPMFQAASAPMSPYGAQSPFFPSFAASYQMPFVRPYMNPYGQQFRAPSYNPTSFQVMNTDSNQSPSYQSSQSYQSPSNLDESNYEDNDQQSESTSALLSAQDPITFSASDSFLRSKYAPADIYGRLASYASKMEK